MTEPNAVNPGIVAPPQVGGRKSGESQQEFQRRLDNPDVSLEDSLLGDPDAYYAHVDRELDEISQTSKWVGRAGRIGTLAAMELPGMLVEASSKIAEMGGVISRDQLPEPWDFPDHVGNFFEGGLYTGFSFTVLYTILSRRNRETIDNTDAVRKAAVGAFVFSTLVQIVGEKYVRMGYNTGDMIDAAYGVAYSAGASAIGYIGYNRTNRKQQKYVEQAREIKAREAEFTDRVVRAPKGRHANIKNQQHNVVRANDKQKRIANRKAQRQSRKKNRR